MIQYGGDYNPEQWPLATRIEDVELMQTGRRHAGQRRHLQLGPAGAARG